MISSYPYGTTFTLTYFRIALKIIGAMTISLGLNRQESKVEWNGFKVAEHLGVVVDFVRMKFTVVPRKAEKVRGMTRLIVRDAIVSQRSVKA